MDDKNCFKKVTIATWTAPVESEVRVPSVIAIVRIEGTHPLMQSAKVYEDKDINYRI